MDPEITAEELRNTARYLEEEVIPALASYAEIPTPFRFGNLKDFPRPSREDEAAKQGFDVLGEFLDRVVAMLYALALALDNRDNQPEVPRVLLATVELYVRAYRAERTTAEKPVEVTEGEQSQVSGQ
jgi:hypothetical protein